MLKEELDITGEDDVQQAAPTFVNAMEGLDVKRRIVVQETPNGFFILLPVSLHVLYHLTTYPMENALYDQAKNISANLWISHWRSRLDTFNVCLLEEVDCGACDVKVKDLKIQHNCRGCGEFSGPQFEAGEIVN